MGPNFKDVTFLSPTSVDVTGTFDTHATVIGDVLIRILVIPVFANDPTKAAAALTNPMVGQATLSALTSTPPLSTVPPFVAPRGDDVLSTGQFAGTATLDPPGGYTISVTDDVRVIGVAVAVKAPGPATPQDPPGFETFTWCVSRKVIT